MTSVTTERISRQDIEGKLRQIRGEVETAADSARNVGLIVGVTAAVVVVGVAFLWGRRKGKKESTVVEIRRV